jgi:hypothetical protein
MSNILAVSKLITGTEPTAEQVHRVQAIAHSLNIPSNDAMMPILIALEQYHGIFSILPSKMQTAANIAAQNAAAQSATAINQAVAKAVTNLGPQVGEAIVKVANEYEYADRITWLTCVIAVTCVVLAGFGLWMHNIGVDSGFGLGHNQAKDEVAAAAWANTPEGLVAYKLARAVGGEANLLHLLKCDNPGWEHKKSICYPMAAKDGTHGWRLKPL